MGGGTTTRTRRAFAKPDGRASGEGTGDGSGTGPSQRLNASAICPAPGVTPNSEVIIMKRTAGSRAAVIPTDRPADPDRPAGRFAPATRALGGAGWV